MDRKVAVNRKFVNPIFETRVDLKVKTWNFSTSKKSALFRCASRCGSRVLIVDASMDARIFDLVMSFSSAPGRR